MSVRRLAEPEFQPASFAFAGENVAWAEQTIRKYPAGREQSAVIPLLMRAQEQDGWVTRAAIEHVAQMLDMPLIRVLEIATFYTQFQLKPVGTKAHIQVCGTTPCMLRGSEALMDVCRSKIHHDQFHLNEGGTLSWEEVECQGACVNAPMVMIFKDAYEDLTPERLAEIIDEFDAGRGDAVPTGPQIDRVFSAPESGLTSLTDEKAVLKANRKAEPKKAGGDQPEVAPSQAAKPKTAAPETDPSIKSPSPVKADPAAEKAASVEAPQEDEAAADLAEPSVEGEVTAREHPHKKDGTPADYRAPEDMEGGPIGPTGRRRKSEKAAEPGKPSPEGTAEVKKPARAKKPKTDDEGGAK
jgi:NADH-quinone oxidoreductase subunit E